MKRDRITEIELSQRDFNSRNARVSRGLYSVYILWRGDETPCALVAPAGSKIMRATCKPEITVIERSRGAASRVSVPATLGDIRGTFSLSLCLSLQLPTPLPVIELLSRRTQSFGFHGIRRSCVLYTWEPSTSPTIQHSSLTDRPRSVLPEAWLHATRKWKWPPGLLNDYHFGRVKTPTYYNVSWFSLSFTFHHSFTFK